jgi:hypothetical protein
MIKKIFLILAMVLCTTYAGATNGNITFSTEQLAQLDRPTRNAILDAQKRAIEESNNIPNPVDKTLNVLGDIDVTGLSNKATIIGDAIVAFCTRLGVGVENFLNSKLGYVVIFITMYKLGLISSFINTGVIILGLIFFSQILYRCNTFKIVKLTTTVTDDKGNVIKNITGEKFAHRFSCSYMHTLFDSTVGYLDQKNIDDDSYEEASNALDSSLEDAEFNKYYRIAVSIISIIALGILLIAL